MLQGSSMLTPISSMPSSRKAMTAATGVVSQRHCSHSVKGRIVTQMTRILLVCLHHTQHPSLLGITNEECGVAGLSSPWLLVGSEGLCNSHLLMLLMQMVAHAGS